MSRPFIVRRIRDGVVKGPFLVAYRLPVPFVVGGNTHPAGSVLLIHSRYEDEHNAPETGEVRAVIESADLFATGYATVWEPADPGFVAGQYIPAWINKFVSVRDAQAATRAPKTLEYVGRLASGVEATAVSSEVDLYCAAAIAVRDLRNELDAAKLTAKSRGYDPGAGTLAAWIAAMVPGRTVGTPFGEQFVSLNIPANGSAARMIESLAVKSVGLCGLQGVSIDRGQAVACEESNQAGGGSLLATEIKGVFDRSLEKLNNEAFDDQGFYVGTSGNVPVDRRPAGVGVLEQHPEQVVFSQVMNPPVDGVERRLEVEFDPGQEFAAGAAGDPAAELAAIKKHVSNVCVAILEPAAPSTRYEGVEKEWRDGFDRLLLRLREPERELAELRRSMNDSFADVRKLKEWYHMKPRPASGAHFECGGTRSVAILVEQLCDTGEMKSKAERCEAAETELAKLKKYRDNIAAVFAKYRLKRNPEPSGYTSFNGESFNLLYDAVMEGRDAGFDVAARCLFLEEKLTQLEISIRANLKVPGIIDEAIREQTKMVSLPAISIRRVYESMVESTFRPKAQVGSTQQLIDEVALLRACISEARGALAGAPLGDPKPAAKE